MKDKKKFFFVFLFGTFFFLFWVWGKDPFFLFVCGLGPLGKQNYGTRREEAGRLLVEAELVLVRDGLRHRVVDAGLGVTLEETRPLALRAVGETVVGVAVLHVHEVARTTTEHDGLEDRRGRGGRGRRDLRGRRRLLHSRDRRATVAVSIGRRSGRHSRATSLLGGPLGRSRGLGLGGPLATGLRGLRADRLVVQELAVLAVLRRGGDDRVASRGALGGRATLTGLGPALAVLGLTTGDLRRRPVRATRQDELGRPRVEVGVLLLQRGAELDALHTEGLALELGPRKDRADTVGEETPGRRGSVRLLTGLLLRDGLTRRDRRGGLNGGRAKSGHLCLEGVDESGLRVDLSDEEGKSGRDRGRHLC